MIFQHGIYAGLNTAPAVVDPRSIPGLVHYLNAEMGVTMDGSNGVENWVSQGTDGASWNTVAAKPVFQPTGFNGKPGVRFSAATGTRMSRAAALQLGINYTVFELVILDSDGSTTLAGNPGEGSETDNYIFLTLGGNMYHRAGNFYWGAPFYESIIGLPTIRAVKRAAGVADLYIDNTNLGGTTSMVNNFSPTTLGAFANGQYTANGIIRIQLAYNRALTPEEQQQVYDFLYSNI
jgi:hypothetical protein